MKRISITYACKPGHVSRTGKALCTLCQRLATHEGAYYRNNGVPACLYFCAEHASRQEDVLPLRELGAALLALGDQVTVDRLFSALEREGVCCCFDTVQNALWLRMPSRFAWTRAADVAERRKRWEVR